MARLGISIYPEHSTEEQDIAYMRKAGKLGYKRIFTCLLSIGEKSREEIIGQFCRLADEAHACGMEIIPDVLLYFQGWESPLRTCPCFVKCMWTASGWTRDLTA